MPNTISATLREMPSAMILAAVTTGAAVSAWQCDG
jgi:hypothetical protein